MKNELKIKANFGQDKKARSEFEKDTKRFLNPLQKSGVLKYKMISQRICDFCKKPLAKGDSFKTLKDGRDICKKCENKGE